MRIFFAIVLGALLFSITSPARATIRTGSFDTTIVFMDTTRLLACYVPTTYTDTNEYRLMICLHGLGDNSGNYRSALISSLGWPTHFPNTIFICPEAAATTDDFYQFAGDETIVDTCIKFAMANYHIDTSNVILQGFSLGGRAALRYGLDHYSKFKALLLNTPAIQGVKNALNEQPSYQYTYANASHIPIYITHGEQDILYEPPIDSALKIMIENNGIVRYNDVANIAHTIPSFSRMADVLTFFDRPAHLGNDLEISELDAPMRTITTSVTPGILLRNVGSDTITSATVTITLNGQAQPFRLNHELLPFQHDSIVLPMLLAMSGQNILDVRVDTINNIPDTVTSYDNVKIDTFEYVARGVALPVSEGFEDAAFPPPGWLLQPAGDAYSPWFQDTVRKSGNFSAGAFNTIFIFDNEGRAEGLLSPVVDLTSMPNPQLSFDLAFNYVRYTPPYIIPTTDFTDTLDVLISTDGGATYSSLLRKDGADLATFAEPIMNPLSIAADFITPQDTNWRHYNFDLSPYSTASKAIIKFNYISGLGGSIYIDNVSLGGSLGVQAALAPASYGIYPNPATDRVTVAGDAGNTMRITVLDMTGRPVLSEENSTDNSGASTLDIHSLAAGVYLVRTTTGVKTRMEKLVIER